MMEFNVKPGIVCVKTNTREEANAAACAMKVMLDFIALEKHVFLLKDIECLSDEDFTSRTTKWMTTCRFSVLDGPPGIYKV